MLHNAPAIGTPPADLAQAVREGFAQPVPGLTLDTASPSVAELVEVLGVEAVEILCDRWSGINREIGKPSQDIINEIGEEKAIALRDYWGRGRIYIPRRALSTKVKHDRIRQLAKQGHTKWTIARRVGMSERQVYNVLAAERAAARTSVSVAPGKERPRLGT